MADWETRAVLSLVDANFTQGFKKAIGTVKEFDNQVASMSDNIREHTSNFGNVATMAGAAITAFGDGAVKSFGDFQAQMNKAAVVAGGTSKDIGGLSDVANEMAKDLPIDAQQAGEAMVGMAQNGAGIRQLKEYFPPIAKAATAASADLGKTAEAVQQSMNIWSGSATRNAAVLVQTANLSNASIETMGDAFSNVGTNAKSLGMSIDVTSEAIGLLTNRGMSSARASMDLNHALVQMVKPSKAAQTVMEQLGISYTDAHGHMKPFREILEELNKALASYSPTAKQAALATLFGTAGEQAMLPLMQAVANTTGNASNSWDAYEKQLRKAAGTTEQANKTLDSQAQEMQKNVGSAIEQVGGSFDDLKNTAMQSQDLILRKTLNTVANLISSIQNGHDAFSTVIKDFIGLSPIIGPAVTSVGMFAKALSSIGTLINPWTLFAVTLGLIAGKLIEVYNSSKPLRDAVNAIGTAFKQVFGLAINNLLDNVKGFFDSIGGKAKGSSKELSGIGKELAKSLNSIDWRLMFANLQNAILTVVSVIRQLPWQSIFNSIISMISKLANFIRGEMAILRASGMLDAIETIAAAIGSLARGALSTLSSILPPLLDDIEIATTAVAPLVSIIAQIVGEIGAVIGKIADFNGKLIKAHPALAQLEVGAIAAGIGIGRLAVELAKTGQTEPISLAFRLMKHTVVGNISDIVSAITGAFGKGGKIGTAFSKFGAMFSENGVMGKAVLKFSNSKFVARLTNFPSRLSAVFGRARVVINKGLAKSLASVANLGRRIGSIATRGFKRLLDLSSKFSKSLMSIARKFGSGALSLAKKAGSGIVRVASIMKSGLLSAMSAIKSGFIKMTAVMSANPYAAAIAAIAAIVAALVWFFTQTKTGRRMWANFVKWFKNLWQNLSKWLSNLWNGMKKAAENIWNAIKNVIKWYVNTYKMIITKIWGATIGWVIKSWSNMFKSVKDIFEHGHYYMTHPIKLAQKLIGTYIDQIKNLFKSLGLINLWNAGKKIIDSLIDGFKSGYENVKNFLHNITGDMPHHKGPESVDATLFTPAGRLIMQSLNNGLREKYRDVQATLHNMTDDIGHTAITIPADFNDQMNDLSVRSRMSLQANLQDQQIQIDRRPAQIKLNLGGHEYSTFVSDISREQDKQYDLQRRR